MKARFTLWAALSVLALSLTVACKKDNGGKRSNQNGYAEITSHWSIAYERQTALVGGSAAELQNL